MDIAPEKLEAFERRLAAEREKRRVENALAHYVPYAKQAAFHKAGATHRERLLIAANQSGKTLAGGMECAMHATGRYPGWWEGKRFDRRTIGRGAGTTNETTRDTVQRILVGRPGQPGTPLLGMSEVVRRFLLDKAPDRSVTTMTLDDVDHYTAEEKARIAASYAPHEREARTKGPSRSSSAPFRTIGHALAAATAGCRRNLPALLMR